jgi:hypothetical protein
MTHQATDDGYTLGLLVDLRDLCTKIGDSHRRMAAELHDLLRRVARPDVPGPGLDKDFSFRVQQTALGEYGEALPTISLNGNAEVATGRGKGRPEGRPVSRITLLVVA